MRAGPLSDSRVIALLNKYFVPVYSSNEEVAQGGTAPAAEKVERQRIYLEFFDKKMPIGDVHVYILTPDAVAYQGIPVGDITADNLTANLKNIAAKMEIQAGGPVAKIRRQSVPPSHPADSMVFHLIARGSNAGTYREFPSENWIILSREEVAKILPRGDLKPGFSWDIDKGVAFKWLAKFYPQTVEVNNVERSRIDQHTLRATVISLENGAACARIEGSLLMKRSFTPNHDDNFFVRGSLLGFINFNAVTSTLQTLRIITTKAIYGDMASGEGFSAALRSMSPAALQEYADSP